MKDLISIVVPVYNVEDYLERAVNSIINQTYTNLEIILVDDGSTDNSGALCDKFSKIDNRIKVIHQKNMGLSVARNIGIKHASGKYIGFVDSDDVISTKMYEMLYKAILEHNSQIAMCKYVAFREAFPIFDEIYEAKAITQDVAIKELMIDEKIRNFCWCKLFEKSLFEDIEFPAGKKFEDVGTTFKLFLKTENLVFVDMKLYGYYIRENSITGSYNINSTLDLIEMVKQRYENLLVAKPTLKEYIDMNRINFVARYFIDISKKQKTEVLKDKEFKKKLYSELEIAKKLNSKRVRQINNKKLNIINRMLFFAPSMFCFIMKTFLK